MSDGKPRVSTDILWVAKKTKRESCLIYIYSSEVKLSSGARRLRREIDILTSIYAPE